MRMACPHCGSARIVRDRPVRSTVECMRGGRVAERQTTILRVTCREAGCGRSGTLYPQADLDDRRAVRDHVVGRALALGQSAAAIECGLERPVVQRHLRDWSVPREADVADAKPDFLFVETAHLRKSDRYLVVDADRGTLVEIAFDRDAFRDWLTSRAEPPGLACLPPDPELHALLREAAPGCGLLCSPAAMRRRTRLAALSSLKALRRREGYRGSNGMPRPHEFERALSGGDTGGWPPEAHALLGATRTALAVLGARSREDGERLWPEFRVAADGDAARRIRSGLETWREPVLTGLDNRFVDGVLVLAEAARRALVLRRPVLGLADTRRLALLRDFERRSEAPVRPDALPSFAVWGRDLASLPADLAA